MILWFVLVLMTAAAAFAVLWPLARSKPVRQGGDVAVYRDQLDEIQRDRATGLIGEAEAEAARVEVSRRLIAAADADAAERPAGSKSALVHRRMTAIAGLVLMPAGALALYFTLGSPDLPGQPLALRTRSPIASNDIQTMVAEVENHVAKNPNDGKGWEVLGPVYMRLGRYDDAVRAWRNAIAINGSNAQREASFGEAVVASANGVVTDEAKAAFDRALKIDPQDVMARFYKGMTADQDGKRAEAEKIWNDLIASAPPNAPWIEVVRHALARNAPAAPQAATAPQASPAQDQSILAMVQRLADRLKKDGSDVNGWLQLVRSYRVLEQPDKMQAAIADAREALAGDAEKLRQFEVGVGAASSVAAAPPPAAAVAPPGLSAADVKAADQMSGDQRNEMIRGMVARLADKLKADGSDLAGWERLLRAYMVLGERDKAHAAAADARKALASDPDKLRQLDAVIKDLKVEG